MDIAFRVRNVVVSEGLRRATQAKVTRLAGRCGLDRADVCFSKERNPRIAEREVCQIVLFGRGRILRAQAAATEAAVAADRVVGKLEQRADRLRGRLGRQNGWPNGWEEGRQMGRQEGRQMGRQKGGLMGRQMGRQMGRWYPRGCTGPLSVTVAGAGSVHFPTNWSANWFAPGTHPDAVDHVGGDVREAAYMGISDSSAEPMTPEEAALEMDEQGSDIYFFVNAESGRPAVVYRRTDGDIALFDSARTAVI